VTAQMRRALSLVLFSIVLLVPRSASMQVPGTTARAAIEAAAAALGGADRIRALKNVTLVGYAQYAYRRCRVAAGIHDTL